MDVGVRMSMRRVVANPYFEHGVLVAILVSTVMLGLDNPLNDPSSMLARTLAVLDLVIVGIFLFEFAIKVVAMIMFTAW